MARAKQKVVFTAEPTQVEWIRDVVESGRYRSSSELIREAIDDKIERVRREVLAEQVSRYCDAGLAVEEVDFVDLQAFEPPE